MGGRSVHLYHILDEAPNIPLQLVTWMETSTWSLRMKSSSLLWINGPNSRLDRAKCLPLLKLTTRLRNLMCAQREVVRHTVPNAYQPHQRLHHLVRGTPLTPASSREPFQTMARRGSGDCSAWRLRALSPMRLTYRRDTREFYSIYLTCSVCS